MGADGEAILRNACFYLFEMYGGPFGMQQDPGAAITIMFNLIQQIKGRA